MSYRKQLFSR